jgi:hypothetical protein
MHNHPHCPSASCNTFECIQFLFLITAQDWCLQDITLDLGVYLISHWWLQSWSSRANFAFKQKFPLPTLQPHDAKSLSVCSWVNSLDHQNLLLHGDLLPICCNWNFKNPMSVNSHTFVRTVGFGFFIELYESAQFLSLFLVCENRTRYHDFKN